MREMMFGDGDRWGTGYGWDGDESGHGEVGDKYGNVLPFILRIAFAKA